MRIPIVELETDVVCIVMATRAFEIRGRPGKYMLTFIIFLFYTPLPVPDNLCPIPEPNYIWLPPVA